MGFFRVSGGVFSGCARGARVYLTLGVKWGKGGDDVIFSRSFIGGHLGLGGGEANSEPSILLSVLVRSPVGE